MFNLITVGSDYRLQGDDCGQRPMRTQLSRINSIFFLRARRANRQQHRPLPRRITSLHLPLSLLFFYARLKRRHPHSNFLTERSSIAAAMVAACCVTPTEDGIGNVPINRLSQITVYMHISMRVYRYHRERGREGRKKEIHLEWSIAPT